MLILAFLPPLSFILLFLIFFSSHAAKDNAVYTNIRKSILYSFLMMGLLIVIITEALSYNHLLETVPLSLCWTAVVSIQVVYILQKKILPAKLVEVVSAIKWLLRGNKLLSGICLLIMISLLLAILYPPNNFDSMTYHMARVAHWEQNKSISHFATHIPRQLIYQPFAEWTILHFQILSGSDRLANSVQLFAFVMCITTVSLITKILGGTFKQQSLSALFAALIPMAVLQSNTTQNDIVVASFVLAFVYFAISADRMSWKKIFFAGLALGLASLTKGTSYIFLFPFCLWYLKVFKGAGRNYFANVLVGLSKGALILIIALSLNAGHFYRNFFLAGNLLGGVNNEIMNEGFNIKSLFFVFIKDFLSEMPVNLRIIKAVIASAGFVGVDINDPHYSLASITWMRNYLTFHEDYMQNFIHALIIGALFFSFFLNKKNYSWPPSKYFLFTVTAYASTLLFVLLLKWQPWTNRLQLSLFFLFSAFMGIELSKLKKRFLDWAIIFPMTALAVTAILLSSKHFILPPGRSIFMKPYNDFIYEKGELECKEYIDKSSFKKIGLYIGSDSRDYPYFKLLSKNGNLLREIKHVMVNNETSVYVDFFKPDVIISIETRRDAYILGNTIYTRKAVFEGGPAIYAPSN